MNYYYIFAGMAAIGFGVWLLTAPSRNFSVTYTPGAGCAAWTIWLLLLVAKFTASIYLVRSHIVNAADPTNLRIGIVVLLVSLIMSFKLEIN